MIMFFYKLYNNLLHAPNKIFYPISPEIIIDNNFKKKGYKISKTEDSHKDFLSNLLKNIYKDIDLNSLKERMIKKNENSYSHNIFDLISLQEKESLEKYYSSQNQIDIVSSLLGTKCKLRNILINFNFYNGKTIEEEGSKMWHRDSDSLSDQLKIFIPLTSMTFENGMFYFISNEDISSFQKFKLDKKKIYDENISTWNKFRTEDKKVINYLQDKKKIKYFMGNLGDILYIDTSRVYHKGGYVKSENSLRLMLQLTYTPILSLTSWNNNQNRLSNFLQKKLTNLKIKLQKNL